MANVGQNRNRLQRLSGSELALATSALALATIIYIGWGLVIGVKWGDAALGAHTEAAGFVFDIALFGVIFSLFRRRWEARASPT